LKATGTAYYQSDISDHGGIQACFCDSLMQHFGQKQLFARENTCVAAAFVRMALAGSTNEALASFGQVSEKSHPDGSFATGLIVQTGDVCAPVPQPFFQEQFHFQLLFEIPPIANL